MSTVQDHYTHLLAEHYEWIYGGYTNALSRFRSLFEDFKLTPTLNSRAVDLGCGSGFQAIPLAEMGYRVAAIDSSEYLLELLKGRCKDLPITTFNEDLCQFRSCVQEPVELIVCMTDTLLHLDSREEVLALFADCYKALSAGGQLLFSFRDLSMPLQDLDRFLSLTQDEERIFTCFLEYEEEQVKVHDLLHVMEKGKWHLRKSFYRKLRLSPAWVEGGLRDCGFERVDVQEIGGMFYLQAFR